MALELRALMPEDAGTARALVSGAFSATRYEPRLLEQLETALRFEDPECMALLAFAEGEKRLAGLVLFGTVAGARSVVKVHAVIGPDRDAMLALLDAVRQTCENSGERMIVCEIPNDRPFALAADALLQSDYVEEGRVSDFVSDGTDLRLLVWRA